MKFIKTELELKKLKTLIENLPKKDGCFWFPLTKRKYSKKCPGSCPLAESDAPLRFMVDLSTEDPLIQIQVKKTAVGKTPRKKEQIRRPVVGDSQKKLKVEPKENTKMPQLPRKHLSLFNPLKKASHDPTASLALTLNDHYLAQESRVKIKGDVKSIPPFIANFNILSSSPPSLNEALIEKKHHTRSQFNDIQRYYEDYCESSKASDSTGNQSSHKSEDVFNDPLTGLKTQFEGMKLQSQDRITHEGERTTRISDLGIQNKRKRKESYSLEDILDLLKQKIAAEKNDSDKLGLKRWSGQYSMEPYQRMLGRDHSLDYQRLFPLNLMALESTKKLTTEKEGPDASIKAKRETPSFYPISSSNPPDFEMEGANLNDSRIQAREELSMHQLSRDFQQKCNLDSQEERAIGQRDPHDYAEPQESSTMDERDFDPQLYLRKWDSLNREYFEICKKYDLLAESFEEDLIEAIESSIPLISLEENLIVRWVTDSEKNKTILADFLIEKLIIDVIITGRNFCYLPSSNTFWTRRPDGPQQVKWNYDLFLLEQKERERLLSLPGEWFADKSSNKKRLLSFIKENFGMKNLKEFVKGLKRKDGCLQLPLFRNEHFSQCGGQSTEGDSVEDKPLASKAELISPHQNAEDVREACLLLNLRKEKRDQILQFSQIYYLSTEKQQVIDELVDQILSFYSAEERILFWEVFQGHSESSAEQNEDSELGGSDCNDGESYGGDCGDRL